MPQQSRLVLDPSLVITSFDLQLWQKPIQNGTFNLNVDDSPFLGLNLTCEHVKLPRYETSHFLLSKTQSLSLLSGGWRNPNFNSIFILHWNVTLDHPTVFSCLEKNKRSPTESRQTKRQPTSPSGHGCFKHHSDSTGAELKSTLFDGELGGGVTPQAADPWHGTSDQFLVYKRLSSDSCLFWSQGILKAN